MSRRITGKALEDLGKVFTVGAIGRLSDGELLDRFLDRDGKGGEEAFAALVERHGPTVLAVCRRWLGDAHEADDAFQATFLVLARRAASVSGRDRVGNWLYGVALRVSREARRRADRRRRRERLLGDEAGSIPSAGSVAVGSDRSVDELRRLIVEELARLPDRYRGPLLLCDLEGRSRREAADRLGLAEGTLSSRLARGRDLLRGRLVRRGLAPSALIAAMGRPASAFVPASLARRTSEAAWLATTRGLAAGAVPAAVSGLAGEVIRTMFVFKLTAGLAAVGLAATVAIGAAWAIGPRGGGPVVEASAPARSSSTQDASGEDTKKRGPIVRGMVVDEGGKPVGGVSVEVVGSGLERGRSVTDPSGRFAVAIDREPHRGTVVVASSENRARMGFAPYEWDRDEAGDVDAVQVVLKPSREVIVRTRDADGVPIDGVAVEVLVRRGACPIVDGLTEADGQVAIRLPTDAPVIWVIGLKPDFGFDYAEIWREVGEGRRALELPDEIELVLDGARTAHVQAIVDGRPAPAGIGFAPFPIFKDGKREGVDLRSSRIGTEETGPDGVATFRWLPKPVRRLGVFLDNWNDRTYAHQRAFLRSDAESGVTLTVELVPKVAEAPQEPTPEMARRPKDRERIVGPLPEQDELQRLLREVITEAMAADPPAPEAMTMFLRRCARTQVAAGDLEGARDTLRQVAQFADGISGRFGKALSLGRVARDQSDAGFDEEAVATLRAAFEALPEPDPEDEESLAWLRTLVPILRDITLDQVRVGDPEGARDSLAVLRELESIRTGLARESIVAVLAALGEIDEAFCIAGEIPRWGGGGYALGLIAEASEVLEPEAAAEVIDRVERAVNEFESRDYLYEALPLLAEAQARLGRIEEAKRTALSIGEGPTTSELDLRDGQPYALTLVARRQRLAGDLAGARETLELADRILGDHPEMRLRTIRAFEVASEQIAAGDLDGALNTAERIDPGRRAPVLATIAFEQARAGDLEAFRTTLEEAVPLTKIPPEPIENQPGNRPASRAYLQASPTSMRLLTLGFDALLEYIRSTEDEDERGRLISDLVLARSMAGDVAWALEFSRSLDSPGSRRRALYSLISGIGARLELEEQTSHQIDNP